MLLKFFALTILFLAALLLNLCLGEVILSPAQLSQLLSGGTVDPAVSALFWDIRVPRLLAAMLVGTGLAISGYLLQVLSQNYLADPYLTGVSSGSALSVAVGYAIGMNFAFLPVIALAGGLITSLVVALLSRTAAGMSVTRLLLAGIAVSAVCSSLITVLVTSSQMTARTQGLFYWLAGSISGKTWSELGPAAAYIFAGAILAMLMSKPLRLLSLGSESAASLGLDVVRAQWLILIAAVVLCGATVSIGGIVGFVGLLAPYFARGLFGRDQRVHLLSAATLGAILVMISDLASRVLAAGQELPLGTLLSLVGGPFFLWLVVKHKG